MTPSPGDTTAPDTAGSDTTTLVREICRLTGDRPGDPETLVRQEVHRLAPLCSPDQQHLIVRDALARLDGLGELDRLLHDPDIDEVLVNAGSDIWIDRRGILERVGTLDVDRVDHLIERVLAPLGRRVDRSSPIVDARLPDGARVCAVLPPVAVDGPTLSIRRFRARGHEIGSFTGSRGEALVRQLLEARCNVVVSGATSSGKTSLVGALLTSCPADQRLVVIEDTTELPLGDARTHRHIVRLEARPASVDGPPAIDLHQLVRTALRLRPDRLVVGEVRGDEVVALVQAMNTGHDGSISTCHANGPVDLLLRLESLVLQAAPTWPLGAIRNQLARSIDVVIHVERVGADRERRIASIGEVEPPDDTGRAGSVELATPTVRPLATLGPSGDLDIVGALTRGRR